MDPDDAFITGLFEGEGSVSLTNTRENVGAVMSLSSTDQDVVQNFRDIAGCGAIYGPLQRGKNKPVWQWRAADRGCITNLYRRMASYLGARRQGQFGKVFVAYAERDASKQGCRSCGIPLDHKTEGCKTCRRRHYYRDIEAIRRTQVR